MLRNRRAPAPSRTGTPVDFVVVGLGNPGVEFVNTRHNAGAEAVAELAARHGGRLKAEKRLHAEVCVVGIDGRRVLLGVPRTFMNESGLAVVSLVRRGGGDASLVVVHDELDLPSGRVKVKVGGGSAGNNGLKSIDNHLHTNEYVRVRIGIGKPPGRQPGADYVLKRPGVAERTALVAAIGEAADAVETIVSQGVDAAMNRVNGAS